MTVVIGAGYTLTDGKHARVLHGGNRFNVKTVDASVETSDGPGEAAANGLTYEKWVPRSNELSSPSDFSVGTAENITVGSDNQTLAETTGTGLHRHIKSITYTAGEWVMGYKVERQTAPEIQLVAFDGTTVFECFFDLRDGTVGTANNCTGDIVDLGNNLFLCRIYFTPVAASGQVQIRFSNGSESTSYAGSTDTTIKLLRAYAHRSVAFIEYDLFSAQAGDMLCIAGHNLGSSGSRLSLQCDSNGDGTIDTTIATFSPPDDSPIALFFDSVTSAKWRVIVGKGVLPELGVIWIGSSLKMQQPFYAGFSPSRMARQTQMRSNMSETGQFLGRTKQRTYSTVQYDWQHLTYSWVRSNLDGTDGFIQSIEDEPFFLAWRPSETEDVDFAWTMGPVDPPVTMGVRDLMQWSLSARVYGYE